MMDKKRKKVEQYIEQYQMIGRGDRIVTGVSGGADSVCLLFVLCELRKKLGFEVIVCHVNHQLRAEAAEQDEAYVKELCRKLDVPCRIFHENVELIAKNGKKSLEEAGRIVRSNAFETVCRESGANKIATAHHKNDNAETVLLNLARGSGLQGMCGIRPVYGNRIRPLLCLTRKEIEEWLEEEQISYCTDETNEEDEYTRNRIRHKILPVMEQEINRQTVEHINRLSLQAEEIWEYLNLQTDAAAHFIPSGRNVWEGRQEKFDLTKLRCYRELKNTKWLERSLGTLGGGNHFIEIDEAADGTKYLIIHSGSRNLGKQVAEFYQQLAVNLDRGYGEYLEKRDEIIRTYKEQGRRKEIQQALEKLHWQVYESETNMPEDLCFLSGKYLDDYLYDVEICPACPSSPK